MTFGLLVYRNVMRNKRRTLLTVFSMGFSLFLVVLLQSALDRIINPRETDTSVLRIGVRSRNITEPLPLAYQERIEKIPGVRFAMPFQWFGGNYREQKNFFPNFAVDARRVWDLFPEFQASEATKRAFIEKKDGAVAGEKLMERFGWKIGDRLTLQGTIFPVNLEFEIVGTYRQEEYNSMYFRYDYFNEAMGSQSVVSNFWVMAESPEAVTPVIQRVDAEFRNTAHETMAEAEKAFRLEFMSSLGNVQALVGSILTVIIFTMVLVAGSTMAMTMRERTREIGILKSIGYPRRTLLILILGEALVLALLGFGLACLGSVGLGYVNLQRATFGFLQRLTAPPKIYGFALAISVAIGLAGAILPALHASGMTITQALRRLE